MAWLTNRKLQLPRIWSNRELEKFAPLFAGRVVNVSAGDDADREGRSYRDYFTAALGYSIANHRPGSTSVSQDAKEKILLDLEGALPAHLAGAFDTVFSHTIASDVFECDRAFMNLCAMSSDVVIVVVPFLQHQESDEGDYWRLTPEGVSLLLKKHGAELVYVSYNDRPNQSIHVFAIGSKKPERWDSIRSHPDNKIATLTDKVGHDLVKNGFLFRSQGYRKRLREKMRKLSKRLRKKFKR